GKAHSERTPNASSGCSGQDECRGRLAAGDLTGDGPEAPRERVREARRSHSHRSRGCAVRSRRRHRLTADAPRSPCEPGRRGIGSVPYQSLREGGTMRIESSVTSISWIPSEAVEG